MVCFAEPLKVTVPVLAVNVPPEFIQLPPSVILHEAELHPAREASSVPAAIVISPAVVMLAFCVTVPV